MMQVDTSRMGEDEMVGAIVSAATFRVVRAENASGRRSTQAVSMSGGRVSMDDTLDMIKLIIVGDSGVGKTCLMLRFVKDEFVSSTRASAPPRSLSLDRRRDGFIVHFLLLVAVLCVRRMRLQWVLCPKVHGVAFARRTLLLLLLRRLLLLLPGCIVQALRQRVGLTMLEQSSKWCKTQQ